MIKKTLLILLVAAFAGCEADTRNYKKGVEYTYFTETIDGHEFIIYNGSSRFGITLHPDCPKCEAKRAEIKENTKQTSFFDFDFE